MDLANCLSAVILEHFNPVLTNKHHILTVVADIESDERRYLASPCVVWMITRSFICPNLKQYDIKITRRYAIIPSLIFYYN